MPVQRSNSQISARPDLATNLPQILMPTTFYSLLCPKKAIYTSVIHEKVVLYRNICLYKKEVIRIETACPKDRLSPRFLGIPILSGKGSQLMEVYYSNTMIVLIFPLLLSIYH